VARLENESDADLLGAPDPDGTRFAAFYRRHAIAILAFLARRDVDTTTAGDLTAETFATALLHRRRYEPRHASARPWLLTIAANKLVDRERGRARELKALRRLSLERTTFTDTDVQDYESLRTGPATDEALVLDALEQLPEKQRAAVRLRVVDGRSYADIASDLRLSQTSARQNVHRGLVRLRTLMGGTR
jgi:RNA polymerase sigma-70 factor (ECF subfamily)